MKFVSILSSANQRYIVPEPLISDTTTVETAPTAQSRSHELEAPPLSVSELTSLKAPPSPISELPGLEAPPSPISELPGLEAPPSPISELPGLEAPPSPISELPGLEAPPSPISKLTWFETPPTPISKLPDFQTPRLQENFSFDEQLRQILYGKKLLLDEILTSTNATSIENIHNHYEHGFVSYHKAITQKKRQYKCERCGNTDQHLFASHDCGRCLDRCVYCRHCIMMGKVTQCTPLLTWSGPALAFEKHDSPLHWQGQLSEGQRHASEKIVAAVGLRVTLLVWAVCGAGKTEILFAGIAGALKQGKTVLIATPRSDVVHELTPRIKAVFPKVPLLSLFGGSEDRGKTAQLMIATTHQLIRFEQLFDFVVIDEVDAFPFSYDPMLQYAVNKAAKPNATTILLTATPNKSLQKKVAKNQLAAVKIAKRFHGFPLPVPTLTWSGNWRKLLLKQLLPTVVTYWLKTKSETKQQVFLFVPSVTVLHKLVTILQKDFPSLEGVHSEDPERRDKVQKFRNKEIQLLVTTTILERGVTVPNIAVAVFGADEDVFTESALVQIAGRVGRSADYPTGEVIFFHYGKTEAILDAVDHIKEMNKLAK